MNRKSLDIMWALLFVVGTGLVGFGQDNKAEEGYKFTIDKEIDRTVAKQQVGATCWAYSTTAMLESEIIRNGGEKMDLSEMFIVRTLMDEKISNYVRLGGKTQVSVLGLCHHVTKAVRKYGLVPEEAYKHISMTKMFQEVTKELTERVKSRKGIDKEFLAKLEGIMDATVGKVPETFKHKGKKYTPKSFAAKVMKLNLDDYIEFISFTHRPFYKKSYLEVTDNWDFGDDYYNVPLDELEALVDNAIMNGYSITWDGDTSEKGFSGRKGYEIIPVDGPEGRKRPAKEVESSQETRQVMFDTFKTTDVHLMQLCGIAHDQNGNKFYLIKNSSGNKGIYDGHLYMSRTYFRLKTISLMVNKNGVPQELKRKLRIRSNRGQGRN